MSKLGEFIVALRNLPEGFDWDYSKPKTHGPIALAMMMWPEEFQTDEHPTYVMCCLFEMTDSDLGPIIASTVTVLTPEQVAQKLNTFWHDPTEIMNTEEYLGRGKG